MAAAVAKNAGICRFWRESGDIAACKALFEVPINPKVI